MGALILGLTFQISTAIESISSPNPNTLAFPQSGIYRPAGWSQPALTSITVPPNAQQAAAANTQNLSANPTTYVFDAVMRVDHTSRLQITEHPVQTQANISDHAYLLPAVVTLMIEMSGVMDSYTPGQWTGSASKGVTAHTLLLSLQQSRTFVTLTTRLKKYENMLIESVAPFDDSTTLYGYRAPVVFRQVFLASVTAVGSTLIFNGTAADNESARPQTTQSSPVGTVQTTTPSPATVQQNGVTPGAAAAGGFPTVPGAGGWSSNNVADLVGVITKSATP